MEKSSLTSIDNEVYTNEKDVFADVVWSIHSNSCPGLTLSTCHGFRMC
jgi:hypothetical protein